MITVGIGEKCAASVTQMRVATEPGIISNELEDGNMIPRLCEFAGANACAKSCQLKLAPSQEHQPRSCAEENILDALKELSVDPENFVMVAAIADRVGFGDRINELGASVHSEGFTTVPECNAFFFKPGKDKGANGRLLTHAAMRMADCGDVIYSFKDKEGDDVLGIAHFSRTNMRGPSAYMHMLDGKAVSWGEYVLGSAVEHYDADPETVKISLIAAIEGKNFIHHYSNSESMEEHFPGWNELGFMHPEGVEDFDCLIDYREMIQWQLTESMQDQRLRVDPNQVDIDGTIDTGDLRLGYASHHAASKNLIKHGRDLYIVGLNEEQTMATRTAELKKPDSK